MPRTNKTKVNNDIGSKRNAYFNNMYNKDKARFTQKSNASRKQSIKKFIESDSYGMNFTYSRKLEGCGNAVVRYDKRYYKSSAHYIRSFLVPELIKMADNADNTKTIVQGTKNENYNYRMCDFTTFDDRMINEEEQTFINQRNKYINETVLVNADVIDLEKKKISKNGDKKKIVDIERLPNYSHKSSMDQSIIIDGIPYSCNQLNIKKKKERISQPKTKTFTLTSNDIDLKNFKNNREFIDHYKKLISELEKKKF